MTSIHLRRPHLVRGALIAMTIAGIGVMPHFAFSADEKVSDIGMFLFNFDKPFVSRSFAEQLGRLVMSEKFKQAVLAPTDPDVQDKDSTWLVTFKVAEWRVPVDTRPLLASQVTLSIRKSDGAIVAIK